MSLNNTHPHMTHIFGLPTSYFEVFPCLARSLDLSPIKHVWDITQMFTPTQCFVVLDQHSTYVFACRKEQSLFA
uniref:Uncharacterized protein n=1 Tax=Kryptolebias marmoratus TaxID=37003 RepID=A0A3Q3AMB1_KRYMA